MNPFVSSTPFDLTGEFGGIVFTEAGKRRLRLRVGDAERLLKVPKILRRRMIGNFRPGQVIRVCGDEEHDLLTGTTKWVVAAVLPPGGLAGAPAGAPAAPPPPTGSIRVCAKKSCWRHGGCELFAAVERGIRARGLEEHVKVRAVGCLDRCKQGPNVDWGDRELSHCRPEQFAALLDRVAATARPAPPAEAAEG